MCMYVCVCVYMCVYMCACMNILNYIHKMTRIESRIDLYSYGQAVGHVIAPFVAMMTSHRHSTRTPGLLRPLKSSGTFEARAQQRHILRRWPRRGKKGPSSVLKKRTNVRARTRTGHKERWGTTRKENRRRKHFEGGPTSRPPKTRSHYEHIKKPQGAIYAGLQSDSFSIYATSTNRDRLFILCLYYSSLPFLLWSHPLSSTSSTFSILLFSGAIVIRYFPSSPLLGSDQSMQDFCVDWLDWGTALPSMGTKTCRQHREQEATNCCKLKNTNAHLSDRQPSSSSLSRLLLPYSGFLRQCLRLLLYKRIRDTCILASLYHAILSIFSLERDAIRGCVWCIRILITRSDMK